MSTQTPHLSMDRFRQLGVELFCRAMCAAGYLYFCHAVLSAFMDNRSLPVLLLLVAETITVVLIITARIPKVVDRSLYASTIAVAATFYFMVVNVKDGERLLPITVTVSIQLMGIVLQIAAKLALARSFGILPANRGIVSSGPYRLVRHPMYLGYFLNHLGFFLALASWGNLLVYTALYLLQTLRVLAEERILTKDAAYCEYTRRVPYRVIPGLF